MKPEENSFTEVLFQQGEVADSDWRRSLAGLTFAWAGVLRALKGYSETGTPQPHFTTVPR